MSAGNSASFTPKNSREQSTKGIKCDKQYKSNVHCSKKFPNRNKTHKAGEFYRKVMPKLLEKSFKWVWRGEDREKSALVSVNGISGMS